MLLRMERTRSASLCLVLLAGLSAGACVSVADRTDDALVGGRVPLSAFKPVDTTPQPGGPVLPFPPAPETKTTKLDRSNWPTTYFFVPGQEIVHQPTYVGHLPAPATTPRQRGEFPTIEDAGDVSSSDPSRQAQAKQGLIAPVYALGDALLLIPRAVITPPDTQVRSKVRKARIPTTMQSMTAMPPSAVPPLPPLQASPVRTEGEPLLTPDPDSALTPAPSSPTPPAPTPPAPATTPSGAPLPPGVTPAAPEPKP